jgi:hypothetical protein
MEVVGSSNGTMSLLEVVDHPDLLQGVLLDPRRRVELASRYNPMPIHFFDS